MTRMTFLLALIAVAVAFAPLKVVSYNWSGEDCYITYRVAENFAAGHGLVFNIGERVEAYSNFLWTMMLALGAMAGLSTPLLGKLLSVGAVMGLIVLVGVMRPSKRRNWTDLIAPAVVLLHPMIHYQCDRALETCFYALLICLACFCWLRRRPMATSFALVAVALTRPEGFGFFGVVVLLALYEEWRAWRHNGAGIMSRGDWIRLVAPFVVLFGGYIAWRVWYYGYPMPSTVYAKVSPGRFLNDSSAHDVLQFLISWSFLPLWALLALTTKQGDDDRRTTNALAFFAGGQLVYILAVGSVITTPFRHFIPIVPFVALLLGFLIRQWRDAGHLRATVVGLLVLIIGLTLYTSDNRDAPFGRLHSRLAQFVRHPDPVERCQWFIADPIRLDAEVGRWLAEKYDDDTLVVSGQMGQLGYFGRLRMVDALGLADIEIARKGFSLDIALERDPDLWVMIDYNGPALSEFIPIVDDARFTARYAARYELRARYEPADTPHHFRVFERRTDESLDSPEAVYLGVTSDTLQACYRTL